MNIDEGLQPQQAVALLEVVKNNNKDDVIILGIGNDGEVKNFIVTKKGMDNELQAQLVMESSHLNSKPVSPDALSLEQFKGILNSAKINPSLVLGDVNDFIVNMDIAFDKGALFHDKSGACITVHKLDDKRTVLDVINQEGEGNVLITFGGLRGVEGSRIGETHSIAHIRELLDAQELSAVF